MNTKIKLKNIPMEVEVDIIRDTVVTTFSTNSYNSFTNDLSPNEEKKYLKEIRTLLKDFDDIYSEINKKYRLK